MRKMTLGIILILLAIFGNESATAQLEQPHRDPAVMKADFQQDIRPTDSGTSASGSSLENVISDLAVDTEDSNQNPMMTDSESTGASIQSFLNDLSQNSSGIDLPKVFGSLAIVLGGYLGFVWLTRRLGAGGSSGLPAEVVEVLGQTPFGQRKQLQLVRLGSKLLLLLNNQDGSTQTIGEITDPHEVDYLSSVCGNKHTNRSAIAIGKASSSAKRNEVTGSELKRVLHQLQQGGEPNRASSVFDA